MHETRYDAHSDLRRPATFARDALADLSSGARLSVWLLRGNLRTRYRRSWLGYLWLILPSAGAAIVSMLVQSSRSVNVSATVLPYPLFVLSGMMLWQAFVEALNAPLGQLTAGRQMVTRTRVPHEALILAGLLEVLVNSVARLLVLAAALVLFGVSPAWTLALVPLGVLALVLLGTAIGLLLTPLGMLYDDVARGLGLALTFCLFLTPVLYPLPRDGLWAFNPVTPLLVTSRSWITDAAPVPAGFGVVVALSIAGFVLGWALYRVARPHLVARLG